MGWKQTIIGAGFTACRATGLAQVAAPATRGLGAILMFHHVRPARREDYAPSRELEITPEFFDGVLGLLKKRGWRIVRLDEAVEAIRTPQDGPPVAALTFDDGYRDFTEWALPILARERAPATVFATTGFIDRSARLWWLEVEKAIRRLPAVDLEIAGRRFALSCANNADKTRAAEALLAMLRANPQAEVDRVVARLARQADIDGRALVDALCLDRRGIAEVAAHPLVTIGAHTQNHPMLAKIPADQAQSEIETPKARLEALTDRPVRHLSYPVGDAASAGPREFAMAEAAGYVSAVTTRPGMLFPEHAQSLRALPRLSINGRFQSLAQVDALLTGLPFALWNRGRRVNAS